MSPSTRRIRLTAPTCKVLCVPARGYRDELAGRMLTQFLEQQGFQVENAAATLRVDEMISVAREERGGSGLYFGGGTVHAYSRSFGLRENSGPRLPQAKLVVGIWGATENMLEICRASA